MDPDQTKDRMDLEKLIGTDINLEFEYKQDTI